MDKIALFIAGDERIYFPALVTLLSIKKHNPNKFDYFLCFDAKKLSEDMIETLREHEIQFIDNQDLQHFEIEKNFTLMSEGKWPIEVFYNYALPIYLGEKGYSYSIKADYDLLCIEEYDLAEIVPISNTLGGLCTKVSLLKEGVAEDTIVDLKSKGLVASELTDYMNVGFISFNNKKYVESNYIDSFIEIYKYLAQINPEARLLEQVAFSLMLYKLKGDYLSFSDAYNHRVLWTKAVTRDLTFNIKNIHYITQFKPWKPIDLDKLRWVIHRSRGCLFSFRNLWLEFAETLPTFELYCQEKRLTEKQLAALQVFIIRVFQQRMSRLEKELQNERVKV
ncbi:glycosyltransferase [Pseudomonas serbica]